MDYDYVIDVIAGSKACIADYSAIQVYITAVWANYRRIRDEGRDGKEDGTGKEGKEGGERGEKRKCKEARVKYGGFIDGSHEWGREGSGDRGRVAMEETVCLSIVSVLSRGRLSQTVSLLTLTFRCIFSSNMANL